MDQIVLDHGPHKTRDEGMCAMEFVAWIANEPHTDRPECVHPDLVQFMQGLNDGMHPTVRQKLKPYLGRCVATAAVRSIGDRLARVDIEDGGSLYMTAHDMGSRQPWSAVVAFLEELLPTEELPEVTEAIRVRVGAEA